MAANTGRESYTQRYPLNFQKFNVALNPMYRIFLNFAKFHRAVFEL